MLDAIHSHIAVVGAGHAGGRVVQNLRALGHKGKITLIGNEGHAPYERPPLSKAWLTDAEVTSVTLQPLEFWADDNLKAQHIEFVNDAVVKLDTGSRTLHLQSGRQIQCDQLVIATGGAPRHGGIPGANLPGVHVLRTIDESLGVREALRASRGIAIIGAGIIGMEVASSALELGVPVTVLEGSNRILARGLTPSLGKWLTKKFEARGVDIQTGVAVKGIERNGENLRVVCEREGQSFDVLVDTVLIAIGVNCMPAFLEGTGIGSHAGVTVNEFCSVPSHPWIFAAGDVAHMVKMQGEGSNGVRLETWRNAENQAKTVAQNLLDANEVYKETPWMWTDLLGHNFQIVGSLAEGAREVMRGNLEEGPASLMLVCNGAVQGGILIDQGRDRRFLEKLVETGKAVDVARLADPAIALKTLV